MTAVNERFRRNRRAGAAIQLVFLRARGHTLDHGRARTVSLCNSRTSWPELCGPITSSATVPHIGPQDRQFGRRLSFFPVETAESLVANDFHEMWWSHLAYKQNVPFATTQPYSFSARIASLFRCMFCRLRRRAIARKPHALRLMERTPAPAGRVRAAANSDKTPSLTPSDQRARSHQQ